MVLLGERPKAEAPTLYVPDHALREGEPVLLGKGTRTLDGKWVSHRTWRLTNPRNGRSQVICLLDNELTDAEIDQAYGEAKENFLEQTKGLPRLTSYTNEQRKAVGAAIREYRETKQRMRESTNGKLVY